MDFKSIFVALVLLAALFGWYGWLEAGERRRRRVGKRRGQFSATSEGCGRRAEADGELWKEE